VETPRGTMVTLFVTSAIDQWQDTDRRGMAAVVVTDEPHYRSHNYSFSHETRGTA